MTIFSTMLGYHDPVLVAALRRELDETHRARAEAEAEVVNLLSELSMARAAVEAVCFATKASLDDVDDKQHMFEPQAQRRRNAYATIEAVRRPRATKEAP